MQQADLRLISGESSRKDRAAAVTERDSCLESARKAEHESRQVRQVWFYLDM